MKEFKGTYTGKGKKIGIVVSSFNETISKELLGGAAATLAKCGGACCLWYGRACAKQAPKSWRDDPSQWTVRERPSESETV